jgi:tetratricopeptide (TPR) repeat protein
VRGQLYQERAATIQNLLNAGQPLPTDGEVDFGKLVLEAGKAYSDTIATDPTQMVDASYQGRLDFFVNSMQPFTNSNSSLTQAQLSNVLTDTLIQGFKNDIAKQEADLANRVRSRGVAVTGDRVDETTLQSLWANNAWAQKNADGTGDWLFDEVRLPATRAAVDHYGMGQVYEKLGDKENALASYNRALALRPTYGEVLTALQTLQPATP